MAGRGLQDGRWKPSVGLSLRMFELYGDMVGEARDHTIRVSSQAERDESDRRRARQPGPWNTAIARPEAPVRGLVPMMPEMQRTGASTSTARPESVPHHNNGRPALETTTAHTEHSHGSSTSVKKEPKIVIDLTQDEKVSCSLDCVPPVAPI